MMWIPPEDTDPIILHKPTRKSISVFGAVRIENGSLVTQFSKPFNALTFQKYLELLLTYKSDSRRMHIILDNSRYHHAILLQPWLENNRYFPSLDDLTNIVREKFEHWILPNTILQKLCVIT